MALTPIVARVPEDEARFLKDYAARANWKDAVVTIVHTNGQRWNVIVPNDLMVMVSSVSEWARFTLVQYDGNLWVSAITPV